MHGSVLLRAAIESRGLSLRDAARVARVDVGAVSRWIHGERGPSVSAACRLRDAFGVPVDAWRTDVPADEPSGKLPDESA